MRRSSFGRFARRHSAQLSRHVIGVTGLIKHLFVAMAAIVMATQTDAQGDTNSGQVFYPSCLAAADIVQGKHPAADSPDAAKQLNQAAHYVLQH
jgi:hypothetical protein